MDPPDRTVDSGGGAVFQGDITAGRDITINQITEIRQVSERLSSRCREANNSHTLLGSLEALSSIAKYTEDYATTLDTDVFSSDLQFGRVSEECASIVRELKLLAELLEQGEISEYRENVVDLRSRLTSLQSHLSVVSNRKTAKDYKTIKEALTQLINSQKSTDKASSIRSFVTAPSIRNFIKAPSIRSFPTAPSIRSFDTAPENPHVERQVWLEIERSLRAVGFTTEFVGNNRDLIVASLEDAFLENTAAPIVEGAKPTVSPSKYTHPTLQLSESYNIAITETDGGEKINYGTSSRSVHNGEPSIAKELANEWSESVEGGTGECLLTLDGGGVKSWSSLLIIEALMKEIIALEDRFERQFTHYPRSFEASDFRLCHYFHKMYGTSTGGTLAIALSRLRMTVRETTIALKAIFHAMYADPWTSAHITIGNRASDVEAALKSMTRRHCKQHERGLCHHEFGESFKWRSIEWDTCGDYKDGSEELDDSDLWRGGLSKESEILTHELQTPEYQLCQTICLTSLYSERLDEPGLLRTYDHHYDPDTLAPWILTYNQVTPELRTWQVGRATTGAPIFRKPLDVLGSDGNLASKEGGMRGNNPSYCAYSEAASLWGDDSEPALLLSIGAGRTNSTSNDTSLAAAIDISGLSTLRKYAKRKRLFRNTFVKPTEGSSRHKTMRIIAKGEQRWYKRLEVSHGLKNMKADEWKQILVQGKEKGQDKTIYFKGSRTLETIRTATEVYLNRQEADKSINEYAAPHEMLKQTAEKLVRMRRARELEAMTQGGEKREHWEAFMGKHLIGEREFFRKYQEEWDYALLGRKH